MSDLQRQLAAILADPAEDLPRLAYADMLEEKGQTERAGRIRGDVMCKAGYSERVRFARYINQPSRWLEPGEYPSTDDMPQIETLTLTWYRGFVLTIEGQLWVLLDHGAPIVAENPVSHIYVTGTTIYKSGGNDTYYVGGLGQLPSKYWRQLEGHRTPKDAEHAMNLAVLECLREKAKEWPLQPLP